MLGAALITASAGTAGDSVAKIIAVSGIGQRMMLYRRAVEHWSTREEPPNEMLLTRYPVDTTCRTELARLNRSRRTMLWPIGSC
jgi:hypothetical protein